MKRGRQSRHFTGSGNHSFHSGEGGGGLGPLCIVDRCGKHTSGRGITGMCSSCNGRARLVSFTPADRASHNKMRTIQERQGYMTTEQRRAAAIKAADGRTAEQRSEAVRVGNLSRTFKQYSEIGRKRAATGRVNKP